MATLITGATGYIGSILTRQLADQGEEIHVLCRTQPEAKEIERTNIKLFKGDITEPDSLIKAMRGIDRVHHMAAYARIWAKDPGIFYRINVEGTKNLLEAAKKSGIKKVVYTSTAAVIGPTAGRPMTENDPRTTGFFNPYEETKAEAEQIALAFANNDLQVVIINPSRVYGPGLDSGSNPFTKIIELYIKGKWRIIPGNGNDIGSYCYVDDVVHGILQAMEKGRSGERYILGGVNVTFNEFINTTRQLSGIDKKLRHIPFSVLSIFSHLQLAYAKLTGKPPTITPDWIRKYNYHWALDSSKAMNELGYRIRPLEEGIAYTIEWLKKNRL